VAQKIDGLAWIFENIRRWSRTTVVKGAVDDDTIADACNVALQQIDDLIIESAVPWAIRNVIVDDIGLQKGTYTEFKTRRLFLEQDLGITDCARVRRIWRADDVNQNMGTPLRHVDLVGPENSDRGNTLANLGEECWTEDGDFDASGNADSAILIYNWGATSPAQKLKINYWFTPPLLLVDDFFATDTNGDRTKRPPVPRKMWVPLMEYAKLVILETTGDDYKSAALWRRYGGPAGILERVRMLLSAFQVGEEVFVQDRMTDGGIT
jgi:Arc/MetJ family transcription regulator